MKKKWLLVTIGLVVILSVIFVACKPAPPPAPKPVPPPAPAPAPPPAPKPVPPPAVVPAPPVPAAPPKVYKIRAGTHVASAVIYHKHWEELVKDLMAASMGALDITLFPQGAVAPGAKEFDGVDAGLLDIATTCSMYWLDRWPASALFTYSVAGLSPTESMLWHMREGVALENEMMKATNVVTIGGVITVPEAFMSSKIPIRSLADIKGLKMRAAGDGAKMFARMGASVIFLPATEIYPALQRGVIDAVEISSPGVDWTFATYEVVKYLFISGARQPHEWMVVLANKKFWAELPDGLKVLITEMLKASTWNYYSRMIAADLKAVADFKAKGVTVAPIPKDIEAEMVRQAELFYAELSAKDPFFKKVYDSQEKFKASFREAWPRP